MAIKVAAQDKLSDSDGAAERGYATWKRAKIERALAQAQDRDKMITLEQVLRDFGLER